MRQGFRPKHRLKSKDTASLLVKANTAEMVLEELEPAPVISAKPELIPFTDRADDAGELPAKAAKHNGNGRILMQFGPVVWCLREAGSQRIAGQVSGQASRRLCKSRPPQQATGWAAPPIAANDCRVPAACCRSGLLSVHA